MLATSFPYPTYFDLDGSPLNAGKVYFGLPNQNPITNPISVYWDGAGTQPAAQPIPTYAGYLRRYGNPAIAYASQDYSMLVLNAKGEQIAYAPNSAEFSIASAFSQFTTPGQTTGGALIPYILNRTDAVSHSLLARAQELPSLFDWFSGSEVTDYQNGALSLDLTASIQKALNSGEKWISAPLGTGGFSSQLSIPAYVSLVGKGYSLFTGVGPGTRLVKSGSFNGIVLNGASQMHNITIDGAPGNGGDGVNMLGGRSLLSGVAVFNQGRDGIKVGDYATSGANTNIWRITNCIVRTNGRHGCHIAHEGSAGVPNANAGIILGLEASYNTNDGLLIGDSVDNQVMGLCSQSNGGWGFRLSQYARGNFIPLPYTEFNTAGDGGLEVGADRNFILGFRGGQNNDGWVDNGTSNMVWGRYGSVKNIPLHDAPEGWIDLQVINKVMGGAWRFTRDANGNLAIALSGTGSTYDVLITNETSGIGGVRFSTAADSGALRNIIRRLGVTLNFGSIAAGATSDVTVSVTGADSSYKFDASPIFAIAAGVTWSAYWDATASAVKVRCANVTSSPIGVNGAFNVVGLKIG